MTALLAKAAAMALAQHPVVNATCKDGKSFTYNSSINIAVAVAINGGLITPVLQDADKVAQLQSLFLNEATFSSHGLVIFTIELEKDVKFSDIRLIILLPSCSWIFIYCLKSGRNW